MTTPNCKFTPDKDQIKIMHLMQNKNKFERKKKIWCMAFFFSPLQRFITDLLLMTIMPDTNNFQPNIKHPNQSTKTLQLYSLKNFTKMQATEPIEKVVKVGNFSAIFFRLRHNHARHRLIPQNLRFFITPNKDH